MGRPQDLTRLPDFPDTVNCIPHVKDKEMDLPHMERKVWAQTLCKAAAPHLKMLQKQASYLKRRVTKIVKDDLYHALRSLLHGLFKCICRSGVNPEKVFCIRLGATQVYLHSH